MAITERAVMDALATVQDPELHQDLVTLGMVESVAIEGDRVAVRIQLTTPACPMRAQIEGDVRQALAKVPGLAAVELSFGAQVRASPTGNMPGVKNVVAVGSGKGGVGKSTIAANLAAALALDGADVGLLDADIYGPSQAKMFSVEGKRLLADDEKRILPLMNHGVKLISIANLVEDGQALTWRGPILHGTLTQLLQQTVWGDLDYLIVDLPPGTGDVQLSLAQLVTLSGMVLVTTPQDVAVLDVRRAATMARKTHVPLLGVVENMSYYALPDGSKDFLFGEGGARTFAESEGLPLLGEVPITRLLRESADAGVPLVVSAPQDASAIELRAMARRVAGQVSVQALNTLPMMGSATAVG
jgi:ATP-binding protein involved in chromosome partitioning